MTNPDFFFADDDIVAGPDFYPDGLTREAITALQRDVERELRREGYPIRDSQQPTTRRPARARFELGADQTSGPAGRPTPEPCASPLPSVSAQPGETVAAQGAGPSTGQPARDPVPTLFTPTQAAELLQVPESWLRRRAARRLVPCTFLGKHLRFSRANLDQIVTEGARPAATAQRSAANTGTATRRRSRPSVRTRPDSRRPTR